MCSQVNPPCSSRPSRSTAKSRHTSSSCSLCRSSIATLCRTSRRSCAGRMSCGTRRARLRPRMPVIAPRWTRHVAVNLCHHEQRICISFNFHLSQETVFRVEYQQLFYCIKHVIILSPRIDRLIWHRPRTAEKRRDETAARLYARDRRPVARRGHSERLPPPHRVSVQ